MSDEFENEYVQACGDGENRLLARAVLLLQKTRPFLLFARTEATQIEAAELDILLKNFLNEVVLNRAESRIRNRKQKITH